MISQILPFRQILFLSPEYWESDNMAFLNKWLETLFCLFCSPLFPFSHVRPWLCAGNSQHHDCIWFVSPWSVSFQVVNKYFLAHIHGVTKTAFSLYYVGCHSDAGGGLESESWFPFPCPMRCSLSHSEEVISCSHQRSLLPHCIPHCRHWQYQNPYLLQFLV